jgi:hypothetical protein
LTDRARILRQHRRNDVLRQTNIALLIIEINIARISITWQHHQPRILVADLAKRLACGEFAEIQPIDIESKAEIGGRAVEGKTCMNRCLYDRVGAKQLDVVRHHVVRGKVRN